jgi:hypothetical protein
MKAMQICRVILARSLEWVEETSEASLQRSGVSIHAWVSTISIMDRIIISHSRAL